MYCDKCGTSLTGNEKYCSHCGNEIKKNNSTVTNNSNGKKVASIVLGIISLVGIFLFIFSPISLILSLIGLILGIKSHKEVGNVAGIVINAISLFISVIATLIIVFIIVILINLGRNVDISDIPWNEVANKIEYGSKF